jgi:nitrogen fixation NifU-like protein
MFANVDSEGIITDAAFQGEGCTISQAAASMLTEELVGKSLDDVRGMTYADVVEEMGKDVVSTRTRCATLALTIMKSASERYERQKRAVT